MSDRSAMPSIEIACVGLVTPRTPPRTSFAVVYEAGLKSHRTPAPRFQQDFDVLSGSMYHLGNPGLGTTGPFFAYELLSEASRHTDPSSFLEFAPEHVDSARDLIAWLLEISPVGRLLFTSDWQFGPDGAVWAEAMSYADFWSAHARRELLLNAAYPICRAV